MDLSGNYVMANTVFNLVPSYSKWNGFQVCFSRAMVGEAEHPSTHAWIFANKCGNNLKHEIRPSPLSLVFTFKIISTFIDQSPKFFLCMF